MWGIWGVIGFGVLMIAEGIQVRLGRDKSWFCSTRLPTIVVPTIVYGFIPAGFGISILGLIMLCSRRGWVDDQTGMKLLIYVFCPLVGLSFVFWLWKPRFLQPDWYRWLDDHYGGVMHVLREDAERLGKMWLDRVRTQEGLERWAEEVRQRHQARI